ncbi:MAG: diadenylate cyclase CdaA [Bacillota bacterium]|nr:diadenylate cyclase CdaA [Bacillota bacterium]
MEGLLVYLNYFHLRAVIDILLVAYVVYKFLMLIKGTRAVQLLKGLAVLVIASTLSERFNLYTMNWILDKTWTMLFVALPVVFQPELRRALEQLGRGGFFGRPFFLAEADVRQAAREVVRAAETLARRRVGALIVFARETGLQEYVESGIKVDALVSAEVLTNIFEPGTPLHDGAAIIFGNRILAAGCYLPLTENPFLNKELGTRHRAALGVTEQSDAVAVAVSEETGLISLAQGGRLLRGLRGAELEKKLEELTVPGSKRTGEQEK